MITDRPTHQEVVDSTAAAAAASPPQRVPVNVYETPAALVVVAPLPAVTSNDVSIQLRDGKLRFWAELRSSGPRDYLMNEWDYGNYERELDVPAGFGRAVEASLSNGQLAIRVLRGDPAGEVTIQPGNAS